MAQRPGISNHPNVGDVIATARGCEICLPRNEPHLFYATLVAGQYSQLRIRPGDCVLDAGANVGDFTLLASRRAGDTGSVFAVEPNSNSIEYLRGNLLRNKAQNVVIIPSFLGSRVARVSSEERGTSSSIVPKTSVGTLETSQTTFDEIAGEYNVDHFDVIKMDIEGWEVEALRGCSTLSRVRELAIEVHSELLEKQVKEILLPEGFQCEAFDIVRLVAHTLICILTGPVDFLDSEWSFGGYAVRSAIKAARGEPPSPSLAPSSGLRVLHFFRS